MWSWNWTQILPTSKALHISLDDNPNLAVYKKMEKIVDRMQKERFSHIVTSHFIDVDIHSRFRLVPAYLSQDVS